MLPYDEGNCKEGDGHVTLDPPRKHVYVGMELIHSSQHSTVNALSQREFFFLSKMVVP